MQKPPKPVADEPAKSPLRAKVPCVFCGKRIGPDEKKAHLEERCWTKKPA